MPATMRSGCSASCSSNRSPNIREVNAWPNMRIMLCGGVFGRAEGLWEEIGADLYAATPAEAVEAATNEKQVIEPVRTINRRKRKFQQLKTASSKK